MGANFRSTTKRLSRRLPNKQSCPTTLAQGVGYKLMLTWRIGLRFSPLNINGMSRNRFRRLG
jgi:hypothetical protein